MKKTMKLLGLIAMAAMLFSCEKKLDNNLTPGGDPAGPSTENNELDPSVYLLSFGARFENDTKVTIDVADGSQAFENGDEVLVYSTSGATGTYSFNGAQFVPKTSSDAIAAGSNVIHVYYPASEFVADASGVTFTMPAAIAAGSAEDLGDKVPMAGILPAGNADDPVVTFKNLGSILHVRFNSSAAVGETITAVELNVTGANISGSGTISWSGDTAEDVPSVSDLEGGGTSITIDVADGNLINEAYKEFYFLLPASGTLSAMTVKAIYGKANGFEPSETVSRTSPMNLIRNKIFKVQKSLKGFFSGGDGSETSPYQIATADDFKAIATLANATEAADGNGYNATAGRTFFGSAGVHYVQTANLEFNNATLDPIGVYNALYANALPFSGMYDGNGNTLSKFKVNGDKDSSTGLFEYVDGATLKNITIGTCSVTGTNTTGILTGRCIGNTTIENCALTGGQVTGRNSVGFIAHVVGNTLVKNCTVSNITVITADSGADANNQGGVVGFAGGASKIESCSTSGDIQFTGTASGAARGGIVGKFDSTGQVKECTNAAAITNGLVGSTGGIAGQLTNGTILSCANTANVSGTSMVGGIVGFAGTTKTDGEATNITFISSCRNAANVTGTANCVGGIAGKLQNGAVMSACYATGNVSTSTYDIGGLAGLIQINNNNATSRIYVYDCIANMNVSTSRASGACRTGGAVGNITIGSTGQYVAIDNSGVLDVTITAAGEYVGGFAGWMTGDGTNSNRARIRNCYTLVSSVPGSAKKGGFIGAVSNKAELRYDYFVADDSSDISTATTVNYAKKTAAEIQSEATCTTFNGNNFTLNVGSTTYSSAKGWTLTNGYPVPGALIALGTNYHK